MISFWFGSIIGGVLGFLSGWVLCSMVRVNPPDHKP